MLKKSFKIKKYTVVLALIILITIFCALGALNQKTRVNNLAELCKTDAIGVRFKEQYKDQLNPGLKDMQEINNLAVQAVGKDESLECLYITLRYSLDMYKLEESKAIYDKLAVLAEKKNSWVDASVASESRENLKILVDSLSAKIESFSNNVIPTTEPIKEDTRGNQ